jgi:hypothetical protein
MGGDDGVRLSEMRAPTGLLFIPHVIYEQWITMVDDGKSSPATRHGGAWGERKYSSYSFSTSALDGVSGQRHAPAAFYPRGKDPRYQLYRRLDGPQSRLDTEARGKIL